MSLEQLRANRRKWVEANRENGFEDGIKRLLTDLYPDNAHFIYELLQNAEDTGASVVRFTLTDEAVEFEHDGERLFSLKDVESITSIGDSNKRDDHTTIGKFGVGFKAVFAYTNTPKIHSGDFHFRIHDLVVPETEHVPHTRLGERKTHFLFPFDNPKKPKKQAIEEVERGLLALGDNTLLFLNHIRKIEYSLPDKVSRSLERIEHGNGRIEILTSQSAHRKHASHWLRFQKEVKVKDESRESNTCRIAIAYQLAKEEDKKGRTAWKIAPLHHGQVSIYFPAEKETSNLRFHIHAPFASTVARDSVRDCEANRELRDHLADLVVESLSVIRDQGMLTVGFLAVLPNPQDNLPEFYEPIREAIVEAFKRKVLTPMKLSGHAPASEAFRGPSNISDVITDEDLEFLLDDDHKIPLWCANPPQKNQRDARFLDSLAIDEWGWSELESALFDCTYDDEQRVRIEEWIRNKNDAWLLNFYALLGEACDQHSVYADASNLHIVRVLKGEDDRQVTPSEAFFPPEDDATSAPVDVLFVKPAVYSAGRSETQKKFSKSFLEQTGVRPYDAKAGIEKILEQYPPNQPIQLETHIRHIRQFIEYWKQNQSDTGLFARASFLVDSINEGKVEEAYAPEDLCLDAPYEKTGLSELYEIHRKAAVWAGYESRLYDSGVKDFVAFMKAIGVMHELSVEQVSVRNNPSAFNLQFDCCIYGVRRTCSAIDSDFSISGIDEYLRSRSVSASRLIWNALISANPKSATAQFRPNQKKHIREEPSQLVCHLKSHSWIPDETGEFRKPEDMTREDLRMDFPYDNQNGLLTAIGFGENTRKRSEEYQNRNRAAQDLGFDSADEAEKIAMLIKSGHLTLEGIHSWAAQQKQTEQPKQSVPDPERRRRNVLANTADAPSRESVQRERSIQKGINKFTAQAKAYLRAKYKNDEEQLVCQCCHREMPFKLRSDEYYFEAVQCLGDKETRHYQNRLALCPTCAAMYQYARDTEDAEIRRRIVEHPAGDQSPSVEIPVSLASREYTLHFVGTHWFDLKTLFLEG